MKKKYLGIAVALAAVAMSAFLLVGCGGAPASSEFAGKYTLTKMEATDGSMTIEGELLEQAFEAQGGVEANFIEIKDSENMHVEVGGQTADIKYSAEGNKLSAKDTDGTVFALYVEGNTLSAEFTEEMLGTGTTGFTLYFQK